MLYLSCLILVCVCVLTVGSFCVFQKAVEEDEEEEEGQVRKPSADRCSPSSKLTDADPARKVSCLLPSFPTLPSYRCNVPSPLRPPPSTTHRSAVRVTTPHPD